MRSQASWQSQLLLRGSRRISCHSASCSLWRRSNSWLKRVCTRSLHRLVKISSGEITFDRLVSTKTLLSIFCKRDRRILLWVILMTNSSSIKTVSFSKNLSNIDNLSICVKMIALILFSRITSLSKQDKFNVNKKRKQTMKFTFKNRTAVPWTSSPYTWQNGSSEVKKASTISPRSFKIITKDVWCHLPEAQLSFLLRVKVIA